MGMGMGGGTWRNSIRLQLVKKHTDNSENKLGTITSPRDFLRVWERPICARRDKLALPYSTRLYITSKDEEGGWWTWSCTIFSATYCTYVVLHQVLHEVLHTDVASCRYSTILQRSALIDGSRRPRGTTALPLGLPGPCLALTDRHRRWETTAWARSTWTAGIARTLHHTYIPHRDPCRDHRCNWSWPSLRQPGHPTGKGGGAGVHRSAGGPSRTHGTSYKHISGRGALEKEASR